jgi:hypothetical protein
LIALLGDAYSQAGQTQKAQSLIKQAKTEFQRQVVQFPYAYAGEAAQFFATYVLDLTLLEKAAKWAIFDAKNRPTAAQWLLVANIHLQLNDLNKTKVALAQVENRGDLNVSQQQQIQSLKQQLSRQ